MPVGSLNASLLSLLPGVPWRLPSAIRPLPSVLYLMTTWAFTSTPEMLPSLSTRMPCEDFSTTSGHACRNFPFLSNWMTGCEPRLNTQTLSFLSTATPEHSPKFHPLGSFAQSFTSCNVSCGPVLSSAYAGAIAKARSTVERFTFMRMRICLGGWNVKCPSAEARQTVEVYGY